MYLFTKKFWVYAFERMVKTVAQSAIAIITAEAFGLFNGEAWLNVLSVAGMAGIVSVLMSLQSYSAVNNEADMKVLDSLVDRISRKTVAVEQAADQLRSVNVPPSVPANAQALPIEDANTALG